VLAVALDVLRKLRGLGHAGISPALRFAVNRLPPVSLNPGGRQAHAVGTAGQVMPVQSGGGNRGRGRHIGAGDARGTRRHAGARGVRHPRRHVVQAAAYAARL